MSGIITRLVGDFVKSSGFDEDEFGETLGDAFVEDVATGTRTCRHCGTSDVSADVCGTRRKLGETRDITATARDFCPGAGSGSDAIVPIVWRVVNVRVESNSYDAQRRGGWAEFYDDPMFSTASISLVKQKAGMADAQCDQYIEDAKVIGGDIFPGGECSRMFEELRVNIVVLTGMCSYFMDRFGSHIRQIRSGERSRDASYMLVVPDLADCVSIRLYVWLIYTGGVFPEKVPADFVWRLFVSNEKVFHNPWVRELCEKVLTQTINKDTVYQQLKKAILYDMTVVYDACVAYIKENFETEHMTVAFTAYTDERAFRDIVRCETLPANLRFKSCKLRLQAMSHYHKAPLDEKESGAHDQCVRIVGYIPWGSVTDIVLRDTLDDDMFKTRCNLNEFWKACATEFSKRKSPSEE